jgi:hypothetical protein
MLPLWQVSTNPIHQFIKQPLHFRLETAIAKAPPEIITEECKAYMQALQWA